MSKIAFVFPGQGTQYVGMGKKLYESAENNEQKIIDQIYEKISNHELKNIMFDGSEEALKDTKNAQPAIALVSVLLTKLLMEKGISPNFVAGHSLGEYSGLYAAGFLNEIDTISLISKRGDLMSKAAVKGSMAAVLGLSSEVIIDICNSIDGIVEAVNFNEPNQTVIAGQKDAIENSMSLLKDKGAKRVLPLAVSGPFHSSLMKPVAELIRSEFSNYEWKTAKTALITNTSVKAIKDISEIQEELYNQTFGPVRWVETIQYLLDNDVKTIYEIGPGKVLSNLIKKITKDISIINIETIEDIKNI